VNRSRTYIHLFAGVHTDAKTLALADRLGVGAEQIVGHLSSLWLELAQQRGCDDLSGLSAAAIAEWARWRGNFQEFRDGLDEFRWVKYRSGRPYASGFDKANGKRLRELRRLHDRYRKSRECRVNAASMPRQNPAPAPAPASTTEQQILIPAPHPSVGSSRACRADGATPATRPLQGRNAKPPDDPAEEPARRDRAARAGNGQTGPLLVLQPDNGAQKVSRLRGPDGELLRRFGAAHREEIGVPCRFAFARDRKIAQDLLGLYAPELLGDLVDAYWHEVHRYRQTPDEDRQPGIGASKLDFPGFSAQIPNLFRNYEFDSAKKGRPA